MADAPPLPDRSASDRPASHDEIERAIKHVFAPTHVPAGTGDLLQRMAHRWYRTLRALRPLGAVSDGNALRVFFSGDEFFEAARDAIAAARRRIVLTSYIVEPDRIGRGLIDLLAAAAGRGVSVLFRYDDFGSPHLHAEHLAPLVAAGVTVRVFNPLPRFGIPTRRWLTRDHRKILVVDDRHAFAGSMNVGEAYAGTRYGTAVFRDTAVGITGPAARDLALLVERTPTRLGFPPRRDAPTPAMDTGSFVQVLESNRRRERRAIQRALRLTLRRAEQRCWLTTPYFLPPAGLRRSLIRAAQRGVDVRLLIAGRSDVPVSRAVARHVYGGLLRAGVRIFEMRDRTLHAKTVSTDGVYASVGSFNLDRLSYALNLEVTVTTLDRHVTDALDAQFARDLEMSDEVTLATWSHRPLVERLVGWILYTLAWI